MGRFDKFFSNIQNKESRFYRRLQDLDDLIYDRYFNEFAGKTSYVAEVLSETNQNVDAEGQGGNSTMYLPIRVRIDGIHTNQIPDPYKEIQSLKGEEAAAKFKTLLLSHPLAFPDTEIYSDSAASEPLSRGSRIEVFFAEDGPQNYGRQRGLKYRKVVEPAIARSVPEGANISENFLDGITQTVADATAMFYPKMNTIDFIKRLKEHAAFAGYSDAALAGVAANANAESAFYSTAAGDSRVAGSEERAIPTKNGISNKDGKYCSFGFFQLNVCGEGAEGMLLAKSKNFMNDNGTWAENGQQNFITFIQSNNGEEQLNYVGAKLRDKYPSQLDTDDAYDFAYQMTVKFEKSQEIKTIKG